MGLIEYKEHYYEEYYREDIVKEPSKWRFIVFGLALVIMGAFLGGYIAGYYSTPVIDNRTFNFTITDEPIDIGDGAVLQDCYIIVYGAECGIRIWGLSTWINGNNISDITIYAREFEEDPDFEQDARESIGLLEKDAWYSSLKKESG